MQRVGLRRQQLRDCPADLVDRWAIRPSGEWARYSSSTVSTPTPRTSASAAANRRRRGVSKTPGAIMCTVTPQGPVDIGELADEVGQSSVGDTGIACLRRRFGAEQAADRDDPGPINESVLDSADEAKQSAEFQRHRSTESVRFDRGQRSCRRHRGGLDHHPNATRNRGGKSPPPTSHHQYPPDA